MARTPLDVYIGLSQTRLGEDIHERIQGIAERYTSMEFAGDRLTTYLSRFIELCSRLIAYLDSRYIVGLEDLTMSIDILDHFTSTNKWWQVDRKDPGLVLRPRIRNPREFIESVSSVSLGPDTKNRICGAADKIQRFLEEQQVASASNRKQLTTTLVSSWSLLSGFIARSQGRNTTTEGDFEYAYDVVRFLLFYLSYEEFTALLAIRKITSNKKLITASSISFSLGFEKKLESSIACKLEELHSEHLTQITPSLPSASRNILTNSLRMLAQLYAVQNGMDKLDEEDYESATIGALKILEKVNISSTVFSDESSVVKFFKNLRTTSELNEKLVLLIRRMEGLFIYSTRNRDFLLQHSRLISRIVSLLLVLAGNTQLTSDVLQDADLKRGLILFNDLISD